MGWDSASVNYDNALVESFNGLRKWEVIYRQGPLRDLEDIEFATMTCVDWFNQDSASRAGP